MESPLIHTSRRPTAREPRWRLVARRLAMLVAAAALAIVLLAADQPAVPAPSPDSDPQTALQEGNRLFGDGQLEAAVDAYRSGYRPGIVHPTLAYNLGTALHHLDRIPEAILWYRRGADTDDTWLQENLWLARRTVGSQALPAGSWLASWVPRASGLRLAAIGLAWLGLALLIVSTRIPWWTALTAGLLGAALYLSAHGLERWGPAQGVLLQSCASEAGELPAGTEAWVHRRSDDSWSVLSGGARLNCPSESIELVFEHR